MIIVEGADKVGKTTLVKAIVHELNSLGWPHIPMHLGKIPDCWRHDPVSAHARLMQPYVVWDRLYMSEPIYSSIELGRHSVLTSSCVNLLDHTARMYCGHVIVLSADEAVLRSRLECCPDEMHKVEQVLMANRAFDVVARDGSWRDYHFNVDVSHVGMTRFPEISLCGLRAYTLRMGRQFPYPGAKAWGGVT